MAKKERLDVVLTQRGLAETRSKAQAIIMSGDVYVANQRQDKAGTMIDPTAPIEVRSEACPYVSRGGWKLEKALDEFGVDPTGCVCSDSGASTGGFTDCLLQKGAKKVYAIDVGYGQLAWKLREDPRVVCMERTNIRYVKPEGQVICLIKPQFEAGREKVGKKGVVRDPAVHLEVLENFRALAYSLDFTIRNMTFSPVKGPEGNIEFLAHLSLLPGDAFEKDLSILVGEAHSTLDR